MKHFFSVTAQCKGLGHLTCRVRCEKPRVRVRWFGDSGGFYMSLEQVKRMYWGSMWAKDKNARYVGKSCGESMFGKLWRRFLLSNWKRPLKK